VIREKYGDYTVVISKFLYRPDQHAQWDGRYLWKIFRAGHVKKQGFFFSEKACRVRTTQLLLEWIPEDINKHIAAIAQRQSLLAIANDALEDLEKKLQEYNDD